MFQLKALLCSLLLALLALPYLASGYANPGACSGHCWAHDPGMIRRDDGVYFRFNTGSKIGIWKAPAIEGPWTYQGAAIPAGSRINLPGRDDLWAPEVAKVGNQYIMYYTVYQVILNGAGTQVAGRPLGIQYQPVGTHASEAPSMFERQSWYYLFWSEGICCGYEKNLPAPGAEYKIRVCRSQNFRGPFLDRNGVDCRNGGGTIVLESHGFVYGPGGQGIMTDPKKGTVLYYHYADRRGSVADADYKFGWNVVNWSGGWPSV